MSLYAFDGASPFDLIEAKANNAAVVTGYIVGNPGGFGPITPARVGQIRSLGLGFTPNWERAADFFLTCTVAEAEAAGAETVTACRALGLPDDGTVRAAFSFDTLIPENRFTEMGSKARAVQAGLAGHLGFMGYGQLSLLNYLVGNGYAPGKHWLTESTFGQAYDPTSPNVCMVQNHDITGNWLTSPVAGSDINTITDLAAIGAWGTGGVDMLADERAALFRIDAAVSIDQTHPAVASLGAIYHAVMANEVDTGHPGTNASIKLELDAIQKAQGNGPVDVSALAAALAPLVAPSLAQPLAQAMVAHVQLTAK